MGRQIKYYTPTQIAMLDALSFLRLLLLLLFVCKAKYITCYQFHNGAAYREVLLFNKSLVRIVN